jgi:mRNA interferase RelE/StbE
MKYRIVYTKRAADDISKLDLETKKKIREAMERNAVAPLNYARKMIDRALGTYRFRIGDYRVIFDLESDKIVVLRVGHRREIYKKR